MTYSIVTVRELADRGSDVIYPRASEGGPHLIETMAWEAPVAALAASQMSITVLANQGIRQIALFPEMTEVLITKSRLTLACQKFEKGSRWWGTGAGAAVALGAMAVSAARAAHRRQGKLLLGQLRYEWITDVGSSSKTGFGGYQQLRVICRRPLSDGGELVSANLNLMHGAEGAAVAQGIARRVAWWRLNNSDDLSMTDVIELTRLLEAPRLSDGPDTYALHKLPGARFVG